MKRLGVIPSDPIEEYLKGGYSPEGLKSYYNPCQFFDEVYLLSPLEKSQGALLGMKVVHTPVEDLKKRIKGLSIDVVRAYGGNWACTAACTNKVNGVPVVVSVHDRRPEFLYDSIKHADIVLCVSKVVKEIVIKKFKRADHAWELPNRVDFKIMNPQPDQKLKEILFKYKVLFLGRLSEEKNLDTLIKALKFLGKDFCLIIAGPGDKGAYEKIALEAGVHQQCFFWGSVAQNELASYYSNCDCMCVPSRNEGFGMVFIEALACEAVVITSDIQPMNEYIINLENGLLVKDYQNPQALAETIRKACTDDDVRRKLKKNSRQSVEQFEKTRIDKLEAGYYQKILAMNVGKAFDQPFWKKLTGV